MQHLCFNRSFAARQSLGKAGSAWSTPNGASRQTVSVTGRRRYARHTDSARFAAPLHGIVRASSPAFTRSYSLFLWLCPDHLKLDWFGQLNRHDHCVFVLAVMPNTQRALLAVPARKQQSQDCVAIARNFPFPQ